MSLVLALDVGTSSVRTAVFDTAGKLQRGSLAQMEYPLKTSRDGAAELDPRRLLRATRRCLSVTLGWQGQSARLRRRPIIGVGMSCFWHSLMGVDGDGEPLTPIYTWADSRCAPAAARLRQEWDQAEVHARTGCVLHTSYWPAKLVWLQSLSADSFRRIPLFVSPGEWLLWQLGNVRGCAHTMATGTGLYATASMQWDADVLDRCGIDARRVGPLRDFELPPVRVGRTLEPLRSALWATAIGDGAAGNLGSGAALPGRLAINLGSSAAVREVRTGAHCRAPFGLFAYRLDHNRFLVGGAISNAGNLRAWCQRELGLAGQERRLDRLLRAKRLPNHGLTVLPFWTAERAPTWRDDMPGTIHGLTQATSALDILRAALEAAHHRLAQILELMRPAADTILIVSGGGSRGRTNQQRLADVLGRELMFCAEPEASLRGAAVRSLELLGHEPPAPALKGPVKPEPTIRAAFARERERQAALERRLHDPSA